MEAVEHRMLLSGQLDPTFSGDGQALVNLPNGDSFINRAVAVQADGRIFVAGGAVNLDSEGNIYDALIRVNADGTLDRVFVSSDVTGGAYDVAVQTDGKILLFSGRGGVYRFNADFTRDLTFDGDGFLQPNTIGGGLTATLQPDGKILIAGYNLGVTRLTADGAPDPTFNNGVGGSYNPLAGNGRASGIVVMNDGRIVVSGYKPGPQLNEGRMALAAYNPDGSIDTTFGEQGVSILDQDPGKSLAYDSQQNKLLLTNYFNSLNGSKLIRLDANGRLDSTFGTNGGFSLPNGDPIYGAVVNANGNYLVWGEKPGVAEVQLISVRPDGVIDSSFGKAGRIVLSAQEKPLSTTQGDLVAVAPDGRLVVTASADNGYQEYIARLTGDTPPAVLSIYGTSGDDVIDVTDTTYTLNGRAYAIGGGVRSVSVFAGAGDDRVTVRSSRAASLSGQAGNDTLIGGAGSDTLAGGQGSDSLAGGRGNDVYKFLPTPIVETDTLNEQANGNTDTLDFGSLLTPVTIQLNNDTLASHFNRTVRVSRSGLSGNFENATGGSGNDFILGNDLHANLLNGNGGNDTLYGLAGDDTLVGGAGNDYLYGNQGADTFDAKDAATDWLFGGKGTDLLASADALDVVVNVP